MKYKKGDTVKAFDKVFNVIDARKRGIHGPEYDLEAALPDKNTGNYERHYKIPEGFINRY